MATRHQLDDTSFNPKRKVAPRRRIERADVRRAELESDARVVEPAAVVINWRESASTLYRYT